MLLQQSCKNPQNIWKYCAFSSSKQDRLYPDSMNTINKTTLQDSQIPECHTPQDWYSWNQFDLGIEKLGHWKSWIVILRIQYKCIICCWMLLIWFVSCFQYSTSMGVHTQGKCVSFLNMRTFILTIPPFLANATWRKPSVHCVPQRLVGPSNFGRNCQSFWEKIVRISWRVIATWILLWWYTSPQNTLLLTYPLLRRFWTWFSSSPVPWDMFNCWNS